MSELPAPLTPPRCDVSRHRSMPFDIEQFRRLRLFVTRSDAAFSAGMLLLAASWTQTPAASLPDDDCALAYFASMGASVRRWRNLKAASLADWTLCSDGRWYSPMVARVALETWLADCLRAGKQAARRGEPIDTAFADVCDALEHIGDTRSKTAKRARAWLSHHSNFRPLTAAERRAMH